MMTPHTPSTLDELLASGLVHPSWQPALAPVSREIASVLGAVRDERASGTEVLPPADLVWSALSRPLESVRVLIVGQDPYPTPGHALGLAFSTAASVRPIPRSVANIFRELHTDLGIAPATHADLTHWADQGVLLLNRVLTVRAGEAGSHRGLGWEPMTLQVVRAVVQREDPLVVVLWGNDARALAPECAAKPIIESAHPSPLSASRGFFGSGVFGRVNDALSAQGALPIAWRLPEVADPGMLW